MSFELYPTRRASGSRSCGAWAGGGVLLCLALLAFHSIGRAGSASDLLTLRSRSGQFVVRGLPLPPTTSMREAPPADVSYVRLDPAVLVVSCERVKAQVLAELELPDQWRGTIYLHLHPMTRDNEPVLIRAVRFPDNWSYHLQAPELVDQGRLVRALVQVLLMELANRKSGEQAVELPLWLLEGFTAHVRGSALQDLALDYGAQTVRRRVDRDSLLPIRELLRQRRPLNFDELSWPSHDPEDEVASELYRRCAQLFTHELLHLKDGRACLREMIQRLPENLNWQLTFLKTFTPHFPRLVDVAKWWSLCVVNFTGQDPHASWAYAQSRQRLEEILIAPAQVRSSPRELPQPTRLALQQIIGEWEYARQAPVLAQKINHLQALRLRSAPELQPLIDGYMHCLMQYVQRREQSDETGPHKTSKAANPRILVRDAIKRLNELDAQRSLLRAPAT